LTLAQPQGLGGVGIILKNRGGDLRQRLVLTFHFLPQGIDRGRRALLIAPFGKDGGARASGVLVQGTPGAQGGGSVAHLPQSGGHVRPTLGGSVQNLTSLFKLISNSLTCHDA
jgi:hypothetical protein